MPAVLTTSASPGSAGAGSRGLRHLDEAHPEIADAPLPGDLLALVEFDE
jgi:hypothetical protein